MAKLPTITEEELKSLHGINYSKYFELDIDTRKLTPKQAMFMTRYLDITKKYFKEYLSKKHPISEETNEAARRRSEIRAVYHAITMKGGKRTKLIRKGKQTRRKYIK